MKLNDIANNLLDLGKRNRLLNYKDSGLKGMDVINKNYKDIYLGLSSGHDYFFMNTEPLLERFHKTFSDPTNPDDVVSEYSASKVYDICHEACKANQIMAYKKGYKTEKICKALMKEYNYSITEKGINSLYITFGFVSYKEDKETYKAPLLLIPVEFTKNQSGIYKIHAADDDIILNPTLDYYFNHFRHFDMPDYDAENFDYDVYMESIKKVLPSDVIYEDGMTVGIYSFLKMNMYKDLTDHKDKVLANKNIQALLGNPSDSFKELKGEVMPVVNCDSSQLDAIRMAVSGKSFTLQGPPGSGKSQTITNIIASLIGNGRHVLFVSEKLQALQVVYENLKRAGLSEFAVELHSSKANKKTFIDNLYKTAVLPKYAISNTASDTKKNYQDVKNYVDAYSKALDDFVKGEKITVFDLFSMYVAEEGDAIKFRINDIESHPLSETEPVKRYLREYKESMEPIAYDYRKCVFYGFNETSRDYVSYDMDKEFEAGVLRLNRLISYKDTLNTYISMKGGKDILSVDDLYLAMDFIETYSRLNYNSPVYYDKDKNIYLTEHAERYLSLVTHSADLENYDKEILERDIPSLYRTIKGYTGAFKFIHKDYRKAKHEIFSYRNGKANDKKILQELKNLSVIKNNLTERKNIRTEMKEYLPFISNENMKKVCEELKETLPFVGMTLKEDPAESKNAMLDVLINFNNYRDEDTEYRKLFSHFNGEILDFYKEPMSVILDKIKEIFAMKERISSYSRALSSIAELKKLGYLEFLNEYLNENKALDTMDSSFSKTYLENKVSDCIHKNPHLEGFSSTLFKERVSEFNTLDEQILKLNRDYIIAINSQKRPDDVLLEGSQFKILAHEANKVRKQKPVRMLLGEIYDLAVTIKPVFLMSPLSVSTYLTEDNEFDCVIFDEASQIFAEDAFGAIYRGRQCIIIGDSKQMPPSNFFNAGSDTEEDEDDYSDDMESILDMASSYLPSSSLKWHYRSRSEELIAFSNKAFYDNTLITIPEARHHEKGFGIDFVYLPDGIYDARTRTNKREAEEIAKMVIDHYSHSSQSLGVVAFSKVQADLIEDLVEKAASRVPEIHKYFTDEVDEPFFVKNLETVQGDERDCIIFSICYGYNADKKFFQRFGPLNNLGGERRLNVAVTRSKYNITVVSSIRYMDIKEGVSDSLGVKLLRDYLEFAETSSSRKNYTDSDNGILNDIKEFLTENRYTVCSNYGSSSFRIPLAVKEEGKDDFTAAILLDTVDEKKNTTDSNRLEKLLLERQGWRYYKIYSTGWVTDKKREEENLLTFLRSSEHEEEKNDAAPVFIKEEDHSLESHFEVYKAMPIDKIQEYYTSKGLEYALTKLLKAEEPVNKDYFYRRAAEAMGKTKVSNVVKNEVLKSMPKDCVTVADTIWLTKRDDVHLRINSSRMMNEIPIEELKDGLYTIISLNPGITVEGSYRALIKLLGFNRLAENTKKILNDAIVFLKLDGKIVEKNGCLYI